MKSDLCKVAPAALLESLLVTGNFLEILQEFNKTVSSTRNTSAGLLMLIWWGYDFVFLIQNSQEFPARNCLSTAISKENEGVGSQDLLPSFISLIRLRDTRPIIFTDRIFEMIVDICLIVELFNLMKSPSDCSNVLGRLDRACNP